MGLCSPYVAWREAPKITITANNLMALEVLSALQLCAATSCCRRVCLAHSGQEKVMFFSVKHCDVHLYENASYNFLET